MTEKYEFGSDKWVAVLERVAQQLLDATDAAPDVAYSYNEAFTNPPVARPDGKLPGLLLSFNGRKATATSGVRGDESATCTVHTDFATAAAATKLKSGPELTAFSQKSYADGKMVVKGTFEGAPISLLAMHDAMVDLTA